MAKRQKGILGKGNMYRDPDMSRSKDVGEARLERKLDIE